MNIRQAHMITKISERFAKSLLLALGIFVGWCNISWWMYEPIIHKATRHHLVRMLERGTYILKEGNHVVSNEMLGGLDLMHFVVALSSIAIPSMFLLAFGVDWIARKISFAKDMVQQSKPMEF